MAFELKKGREGAAGKPAMAAGRGRRGTAAGTPPAGMVVRQPVGRIRMEMWQPVVSGSDDEDRWRGDELILDREWIL